MSIADNGTIYFHSDQGIGISKEENGVYTEPEILDTKINSGNYEKFALDYLSRYRAQDRSTN